MNIMSAKFPDRRYKPLTKRPSYKQQGPSRLADLDGSRAPGNDVRVYAETKAPKARFKVGDRFQYEGGEWQLIYMYRVRTSPNTWIHCLESREKLTGIGVAFEVIGAGSTTPRIVYQEFTNSSEANAYFNDIYCHGSRIHMVTQRLLQLKKIDINETV